MFSHSYTEDMILGILRGYALISAYMSLISASHYGVCDIDLSYS